MEGGRLSNREPGKGGAMRIGPVGKRLRSVGASASMAPTKRRRSAFPADRARGPAVIPAAGPAPTWGHFRRTLSSRGRRVVLPALIALFVLPAFAAQPGTFAVAATGVCPNESFRTGAGAALPDCRAYEQASPVDKNGNSAEGFSGFLRAAPDGSAVTFFSQSGTTIPAQGGGTQTFSTLMATRSAESWTSQRLLPPLSFGQKADWLGSTEDLRFAVVQAERLAYPEPTFGRGLYVIDTKDGSIREIVPHEANQLEVPYAFAGASANGERIFFETTAQILPEAAAGFDNLYMWERDSGDLSLVGVLPGTPSEAPPAGSFAGAYEWFLEQNTFKGGSLGGLAVEAAHAISPDGDQAFFTAGETGQLYLRRGLTGSEPSTVQVSKAAPGVTDPNGAQPAAFQEATPDGKRVFFLSAGKLTEDATTGPADEGRDLYRWDAASEELVDVAPDPTDPAGAQVQGLLGISADGSSGYFVARGALAPGSVADSENLYRFTEAGAGFTIAFVAELYTGPRGEVSVDRRNWSPRTYDVGGTVIGSNKQWKTSRTLPDGSKLLFTSAESITGYDNTNAQCFEGGFSEPCAEIFMYSAASGKVICISCNPSGEAPLNSASLQSNFVNAFLGPDVPPSVAVPRNLSVDGNRVFFQTPDPLVPGDKNSTTGCPNYNEVTFEGPECLDVYMWEAPGTPGGSCDTPEVNGGCLYLLSTGQSQSGSYFADASADGSSAFIITASQLVPGDRDLAGDVYAARINGGLASQQSRDEAECQGEGCLAVPASPPAAGTPASSLLDGPWNLKHRKHKKHKKKHKHKKKASSQKTKGKKQRKVKPVERPGRSASSSQGETK